MKTLSVLFPFLFLLSTGCSDPASTQGTDSGDTGADSSNGSAGAALRIAMMPKLMGISFFDAVGRGAQEAADELGVELTYDGPTEARSEDQIRMIDGWVAQGFDVIAVAPNDPDGVARTLRDAQDTGATVVTWDTDANPESSGRPMFVNQVAAEDIGNALVDVMAAGIRARGGDTAGDYLIVSGSSTAANQNVWVEVMRNRIVEKYPDMNIVKVLYPGEDQQKAQEQTATEVGVNPDLKGIWGITSVALPAAAKVVRDAGTADRTFVTGLSLPSLMREYVKDETVKEFVLFSPVDLGYLTIHVASELARGGIEDGTHDFGRIKGVRVSNGVAIMGPPLIFNKDNIEEFDF